jgi:class 3 adenylate cyclase/tetratricopeptide (TPR) repeat protein
LASGSILVSLRSSKAGGDGACAIDTDIAAWLEGLGLGQYVQAFAENDIDVSVLDDISDADLKELGVASLGHRKRLLAAIPARRGQAAASPKAAPPVGERPAGERRQVTILFADLCGFTALSQTLDPEELHEVVSAFNQTVDRVVIECGGTVDKHIGDAVMALFGAPIAHDDDPLRAARTAIDIHEALERLSQSSGRRLQAHIGIANGEVVAGAIGRADTPEYTVLGDSVNLASRLVAAAGPKQTLVSDGVRRVLGGRAECEAHGQAQFKGIEQQVRVWRLVAVAGEPTPASRAPFVGRLSELDQFAAVLAACLARGSGQIVCVRGEAGIGKTRLVDEMRRVAEAKGFAIHRALILDFGVRKGQDPVRKLVGSLLELPANADKDQREASVARALAAGTVDAERLPFLRDLLDLPQSDEWRVLYEAMDNAARNRGKRTLLTLLAETACRRGPMMVVVEDLHWADPLVLGHLAALSSAIASRPVLLIMTSRIEGDPIDHAWRAACPGTPFSTIDLGPLRHEEALSLAGSFIDATQRMALACIDRAGGNPLFLEQLLRNAEEGSDEAVPASIQSLVLARMDRLDGLDRSAFQAASVIGQRFDLAPLRKLINAPDYVCDGLVAHALALPEGDGYLFAHALIQEGAYASILRTKRRQLHLLCAAYYADHDPTLRAQHLDRAGDASAPAAYLAAAEAQRLAYHADTALRLVERGVAIVTDPGQRHALICLRGELQRDLGDISGSVATYREAIAGAQDEIGLCRSELGLAEGLRVSEGLTEALDLLVKAQELAERHDLVAELARLHYLRGNILFPLGKIEGCSEEHERGLVYARRSGAPEAEARALGGLADAAYAQGKMRTAFAHFDRCVAISREHGFGRIEVANRSMAGFSRIYLNQPREAYADGAAAVRNAAMVGQPRAEMLGETINVFATYELADYDKMQAHLERERRLIHLLGARRFEAQNLEMQGRMLLDLGRREEARASLKTSVAICREIGLGFCGPKALSALSRTVDDKDERKLLLTEAIELLGKGSLGHNHLWAYRDAMEAMLMDQDGAAALDYADRLERYTAAEPLPWSDMFIIRGRALARASESPPDALRRELGDIRASLAGCGLIAFAPAIDAALASAGSSS